MAINFMKVRSGVTFLPQTSAPSSPQNGDLYYDVSLNKFRFYQNGGWTELSSATGDVVGPASATDNAIARYDGVTGKLIQDSGASIDDSGNISATNLSGTNTGDVTIGAIGSSPTANGASLSGQVLTLQPANSSFGGVLTNGTQSIAGRKNFDAGFSTSMALFNVTNDSSLTGADQLIPGTNIPTYRVDNASLTSIKSMGIPGTSNSNFRILLNATGNDLTIRNESGSEGTATRRIITGTGADIVLPNGGALAFQYDITTTRWRVLGATPALFTSALRGLVPASGGGTSNFLRADGTWAAPSGSGSAYDIAETSFSGANNQASAANVTGLAFANANVRSFEALVSIYVNATSSLYEVVTLRGVQRGSDWVMSTTAAGDQSGVVFTITSAGQVQYTSQNYSGFSALTMKFRAITTGV